MDAVQNRLKAVHLRPDGVMIRMSGLKGGLVRLRPMHGEHGGVLRWMTGGMEGAKME